MKTRARKPRSRPEVETWNQGSRRPYRRPSFEVFELSTVVRGGGSGPFDIDTSAPGLPPNPP